MGEKAETDTSNPYKTELDRIPGIANTNFYEFPFHFTASSNSNTVCKGAKEPYSPLCPSDPPGRKDSTPGISLHSLQLCSGWALQQASPGCHSTAGYLWVMDMPQLQSRKVSGKLQWMNGIA